MTKEIQEFWPKMIKYWEGRGEKAFRVLREMTRQGRHAIPDVRDSLEEGFGGEQLGSENRVSRGKLRQLLSEKLSLSGKQTVAVSASHATTAVEVLSAVQSREKKEKDISVGVFSFDSHCDIANRSSLAKNSVFHNLLDSEKSRVDRVAIFGPSAGAVDEVRKDVESGEYSWCAKETAERTKIVGQEEYTEAGKVDQTSLNRAIEETIAEWKEAGVTNIVFSVDADVLRTWKLGYTAPEYNALQAFTFLASQDFENLSDYDVRMRLLWYIEEEHRDNPIAWYPERLGATGLSLGELGRALDYAVEIARREGIEVGIKLQSGGHFIGDVVEAGWPDYKGRTAKAVGPLVFRMLRTAAQ